MIIRILNIINRYIRLIVLLPIKIRRRKAIEKWYLNLHIFPPQKLSRLVSLVHESQSQLKQDLFVLHELEFKKNGYFVEAGATNGLALSNTYLLEKKFGWTGILCEPAKFWHEELKQNREESKVEISCLWKKTGDEVSFMETNARELSRISGFFSFNMIQNFHDSSKAQEYKVKTISLFDLLEKHKAPKEIDYLSLDVEGNEYDILSNFDFSKYVFKVITCEHNFGRQRKKIYKLLTKNGYERKYDNMLFADDLYVRKSS